MRGCCAGSPASNWWAGPGLGSHTGWPKQGPRAHRGAHPRAAPGGEEGRAAAGGEHGPREDEDGGRRGEIDEIVRIITLGPSPSVPQDCLAAPLVGGPQSPRCLSNNAHTRHGPLSYATHKKKWQISKPMFSLYVRVLIYFLGFLVMCYAFIVFSGGFISNGACSHRRKTKTKPFHFARFCSGAGWQE